VVPSEDRGRGGNEKRPRISLTRGRKFGETTA